MSPLIRSLCGLYCILVMYVYSYSLVGSLALREHMGFILPELNVIAQASNDGMNIMCEVSFMSSKLSFTHEFSITWSLSSWGRAHVEVNPFKAQLTSWSLAQCLADWISKACCLRCMYSMCSLRWLIFSHSRADKSWLGCFAACIADCVDVSFQLSEIFAPTHHPIDNVTWISMNMTCNCLFSIDKVWAEVFIMCFFLE